MKKLDNHLIGIDQGDVVLFSDFEDGGAMWTGEGPRERRKAIRFSEPFRAAPAVHLSISLLDADTDAAIRAELTPERITAQGFEIVFRTWLDTRIARMRATWLAIGALNHDDNWVID